jgi:hypothetical protein
VPFVKDFYNFKYDKTKDMMTNLSCVQNIAFKLNQLNQNIDKDMIITKITTILPEEYKHFSSAWDSAAIMDRILDNLVARLTLEEMKQKTMTEEEESVTFKTVTRTKGKTCLKCSNCNQLGHAQINCPYKGKNNCSVCKKMNHDEKDCYFRKKECAICRKTNRDEKDCYFKDRNKKEKINFFAEVAETYNSEATINNRMYVVDSGSTCHMTNIKTDLTHIRQHTQCIKISKKNKNMIAEEMGDVEFKECSLKNVSYVPERSRNLLSVNCITENGEVLFTKEKIQIIILL